MLNLFLVVVWWFEIGFASIIFFTYNDLLVFGLKWHSSMVKFFIRHIFFLLAVVLPIASFADVRVGIGKGDITPPVGTPSAGFVDRKGEGMEGVHDPLMAIALFINNGEKQIVLCSVDHLGFTYEMAQNVSKKVHEYPGLEKCEIFIASSHTHSGGGAYLNIPVLGASLAGAYSQDITKFYINQTVSAILDAYRNQTIAKIGIGYGKAKNLSRYRAVWPKNITPLDDVAVIKVTDLDDKPLAILFNYPVHPTVMKSKNRLFSADFVGYARNYLKDYFGSDVEPLYFNGAQAEILPIIESNTFEDCDKMGAYLAATVKEICDTIKMDENLVIDTKKEQYSFRPKVTPFGTVLPLDVYKTEMNVIVLNKVHAFLTVPGELSCIYDKRLKGMAENLGFSHLSIFGLTNDAHGYIITPGSWLHKTYESKLSFGGENYGDEVEKRAEILIGFFAPVKSINK